MPDIVLATEFNNPLLKTEDRVVFADDFNRADGVLAGQTTPIGGLTWGTASDGSGATVSVVISGGAAGTLSNTAGSVYFGRVDAGVSDGIYQARWFAGTGNTQNFLPFRISTVNNHIQLAVVNGLWTLRKRVSGTYTTIRQSAVTATPGQLITIEMSGPSIIVSVDGVLALSVSETDHQTNTMFGIGGLAAATTTPASLWDDVSFIIPGS